MAYLLSILSITYICILILFFFFKFSSFMNFVVDLFFYGFFFILMIGYCKFWTSAFSYFFGSSTSYILILTRLSIFDWLLWIGGSTLRLWFFLCLVYNMTSSCILWRSYVDWFFFFGFISFFFSLFFNVGSSDVNYIFGKSFLDFFLIFLKFKIASYFCSNCLTSIGGARATLDFSLFILIS